MRQRTIMALMFAAAGAAALHAQARALSGEEIRSLITGKRIYLAVPGGGEFPLYYQASGRVDGSGEAVGLGKLVRRTDSGKWFIRGDSVCQQWENWYDGRTICFTIEKLSPTSIRWKQDNGDTGVARIGA